MNTRPDGMETVQLNPETAEALARIAKERGCTVDEVLADLLTPELLAEEKDKALQLLAWRLTENDA